MARPICVRCLNPTVAKGYHERNRMCAACNKVMSLDPYDDAAAERMVQQLYKDSGLFDRVVAAMKRVMRPPAGAEEWKLHHVVELDSRRMSW